MMQLYSSYVYDSLDALKTHKSCMIIWSRFQVLLALGFSAEWHKKRFSASRTDQLLSGAFMMKSTLAEHNVTKVVSKFRFRTLIFNQS